MEKLIYCLDDQETVLKSLKRSIEALGYSVKLFNDGEKLISEIESNSQDIAGIICDLIMPGLTGIEVIKRVRANYSESQIPILICSSKTASYDKEPALLHGAQDLFGKPIDTEVLKNLIEKYFLF